MTTFKRRFLILLAAVALAVSCAILAPQFPDSRTATSGRTPVSARDSGLTALVVYDEPDGEQSEMMTARYIANLLGHFGIEPDIVGAREYKAGQLGRFDAVFVIGSALKGPLPGELVRDVAASGRPVCWLNRNIEQLLAEPGMAERLGFRFKAHAELEGAVSVAFKGRSLPKKEGAINLVSVADPSKAKVLAVARNKRLSTPYAIRSGNFWYFADIVFSYTVEADRSLVFSDLLHDILGQPHETRRYALVRIEDVNPESRPEQLRKVADVLASRGIPFQVSLVPIYKNTTRRVEIYLSDRPRVVEALQYMVSRGGSIVMHGVTHQLRGDTTDDFEFWDSLTEKPSGDSAPDVLEQKLALGMDECFRAGLFPIAWETPHYTASMAHYRALRPFFSHAYDRRLVGDDRNTMQYFPYELEDIYGQSIIPENLGYVNLQKPDSGAIVDGAARMLCVRDSIPSFFFHPFVSPAHLETAVDGITRLGYRFISAQNFGCSAVIGNHAVSTIPGTVSLAANQPFLRRVAIDARGQAAETYQAVTRGKVLEETLAPPPGGLAAVQGVLRVPGPKRKPPLRERILAWWNNVDVDSIPSPKQAARRALLLVNAPDPSGPGPGDAGSFESFLGVYGVRFERVDAARLDRRELGEDSVVFVPRVVAAGLGESAREDLAEWLHDGGRLVLEGRSRLAEDLGFIFESRKLSVISTKDILFPGIRIIWNRAEMMERFDPPPVSTTLIEDEESGRPVAVAARHGNGLLIYLGTDLDPETGMGYTRYPYLYHHLRGRMRLASPVTAHGVEFYFDPGYREQAPLEKLVASWHADGIRAVYAAAWHFYPRWQYDYDTLIRLCHERGIAVYAWFELPQVHEKLWNAHPEWREKTVTGKDGQVGWRKQMNLANRDCRTAALDFFEELLTKHDWDGVNLAELSFDTGDGLLDPDKYVPMNRDVREDFRRQAGFDPIRLFDQASPLYWQRNRKAVAEWEVYRTRLLNGWMVEFLDRVEKIRRKRSLDCIVTSLDSLHAPRIVERTGTDTRDVVALMDRYDFTLQVEDPMDLWGDSPDRYSEFSKTYSKLVRDSRRLMFDINVVTERKKGLAPTKLPAGTELALTAFSAARAGNGRVAIYSEASLQPEDRALLPFVLGGAAGLSVNDAAATNGARSPASAGSAQSARIRTERSIRLSLVSESGKDTLYLGPAGDAAAAGFGLARGQGEMLLLDNEPWQCGREGEVLIPAGEHTLGSAKLERDLTDRFGLGLWVKDVTAEVSAVTRTSLGIAIEYASPRRAWVVLTREPNAVYLDGVELEKPRIERYGSEILVAIPSGRHRAEINDATTASAVVDMASAVSSRSVVWLGGKLVLILAVLFVAVRARRLFLVFGSKLK